MPITTSKVKVPLGMQTLDFWPIATEPDKGHPTYEAAVNLGAAVKGYLTISANAATIPGDDIDQLDVEMFADAQLDSETTMNDLEVNALLFGHTWSEESGEDSKSSDYAKSGGLSFIEPIMKKDKSVVYRATCLYKCTARASSEKQEADTRKRGEFNPKMNSVSFKVSEDNIRSWRVRKDCDTKEAAEAFIKKTFGAAT